MPQGSTYDDSGKLIWKFDICCEFDCNISFANKQGINCGGDFTKPPCMFNGEHVELNLSEEYCEEYIDGESDESFPH